MLILERPNFHPHVCIQCGVGDDRRVWYVDLQLAIDNHFNPLYNGAIYFCNECWDDMVRVVSRDIQGFTPARLETTQTYDDPNLLAETLELKQETNDGLPSSAGGNSNL